MSTYPKSPKDETNGMMYFPRMIDKIRLHARGELAEDYHASLGTPKTADSICCNFLRIDYVDLVERVKQGGSDEELLQWCFEKGRSLNQGDLLVWNNFMAKFGWNDFATGLLEEAKQKSGIPARISTIVDMIDYEEKRIS